MSETVIKFIILFGQKIRSRILQFRVGSDTCWFRKVRLVKFNREQAVGQFGFRLDQLISGRLKSPRKIILGRGEGSDITYVWILIIFLQNPLQGRKEGGKQG